MILPLLLALQVTPVAPIQKGTALPPPESAEGEVLAPVERIFAAMRAKESARILAEVDPAGRLTSVVTNPDGTSTTTGSGWGDFAARFAPGAGPVLDERLTGTPAIEIDGDVAMVWSSYVFRVDGNISHCGTDHVDLVRTAGRWRVVNLTWSKRTTGCPAA